MKLYTLGYEGLSIESFIARLESAGIATVLDVRELPLSRKPGFSKRSFAERLSKSGIAYAHMPTLGCPKSIRDKYKADNNWAKYEKAFLTNLATRSAELEELAEIAKATSTCLVCFEADFTRCHRRLVAQATVRGGKMQLAHITAETIVLEEVPRKAA